jgi:hypothetical protein
MPTTNSSIGRTTRHLMSQEAEMLKVKKLSFGATTAKPTRNGTLSISIKTRASKVKDSTKNGASISTDHSTSDQDSQCTESLSATVQTTSGSRDTKLMSRLNNSTSTRPQRPSSLSNGRIDQSPFKATVVAQTLEWKEPTLDGGNFGESKVSLSSMKEERLLMFMVESMTKTETSLPGESTERSINNGTSSMLMNIQRSQ